MKKDSRTAQFDQETATLLFDKVGLSTRFQEHATDRPQLREKIVRRIEDDRHQQERHQRRRVDALRSVIRHLEPAVEVNDTYEKIRPRLEKTEEFRALELEDLRRSAFDKHIRRLKDKQEEREKDRERKEKEKEKEKDRHRRPPREESRNGYDSYHKPRSSRHERERSRHATRSPEPDAYEAERRRAAGERERQYRRRDSSIHRSERGGSRSRHERTESVYDRERREREEERERQYRSRGDDSVSVRDRDEYRPRRRRGLSPEDDERDAKVCCTPFTSQWNFNSNTGQRTRRERTPRARTPPPRERIFDDTVPVMNYGEDPMMDYGKDPYTEKRRSSKAKPKETKEKPIAATKEKEEDKEAAPPAAAPAESAASPKPVVEAKGGDKMDVDTKGEESEEGEIAE